jgi:cytochrome c-type biogenesis protein CcmH/NrfG
MAGGNPSDRHRWLFQLGPAYVRAGEPRKAIAVLREALGGKGFHYANLWSGIMHLPHGLHALGLAYEQAGDKTAARETYARLLRLWSDADPDLPDLIDTKARLASLEAVR